MTARQNVLSFWYIVLCDTCSPISPTTTEKLPNLLRLIWRIIFLYGEQRCMSETVSICFVNFQNYIQRNLWARSPLTEKEIFLKNQNIYSIYSHYQDISLIALYRYILPFPCLDYLSFLSTRQPMITFDITDW